MERSLGLSVCQLASTRQLLIVVKMRSYKKLVSDDLLKLALFLSLLKVDPSSYLGNYSSPLSFFDPVGDNSGPAWTQTQAMGPDPWGNDLGFSPSLNPKSMESLLEAHQHEIIEDLNNLGRYSRLSALSGLPVHISAYIVDTGDSNGCFGDTGSDSDSGISDTAHDDSEEEYDSKAKEKASSSDEDVCDNDMDMEVETVLENLVHNENLLGLNSIVGLTPPPEEDIAISPDLLDLGTGQDALEAELVHIDEQLMNIEDDLGQIDETFLMMDHQIAQTISDDETFNHADAMAAEDINLDALEPNNPFDDWERDALTDLGDIVLEDVDLPQFPALPDVSEPNFIEESELENLVDDNLLPIDPNISGTPGLEDFNDDLFENTEIISSKFGLDASLGEIVKNDVILSQSPFLTNSSNPYGAASLSTNVNEVKGEPVKEEVKLEEDMIMQVLRESNIDFNDIPLTDEDLVKQEDKELVKEEVVEESIDIDEVAFEVSLTDGASAKVEIDYDKLHDEVKSRFTSAEDGTEIAEIDIDSEAVDEFSFNPYAFDNDHSSYTVTELKMVGTVNPRKRNESESSGYHSMGDSSDMSMSAARCRDEKLAKKLGLPFSVHEIINSPVDNFNELLTRPGLSSEQSQLCRDIRRRGKNKVAAQNCRKRKMDTIEELQAQVDQVRRRKEQLLAEREALEMSRARWSSKLSYLEQGVLAGMGKELGIFTIELTEGGVVVTGAATNTHLPYQLLGAVGGAAGGPSSRGGRSRD